MKGTPRNNGRPHDAVLIRRKIARAIKVSKKSRSQVAKEMTAILQVSITERMLTAFAADSKELHRWPAEFDIAFCEAVDDYSLLAERVRRAGFRMIGPEEEKLLEVGRAYLEKAKAEAVLAQAWRDEVSL
jgi:hypothetical protein